MSILAYLNPSRPSLLLSTLAALGSLLAPLSAAALTDYERDQITFMKEEEKLARDVYTTLGETWDLAVFTNIARSEQTHMDRMDTLLTTYALPDPAQPAIGVFTNPVLQHLYDRLVAAGSVSARAALGVGEMIEITDINDLTDLIAGTNLADVQLTADRLRNASYNHLAAFRAALDALPPLATPTTDGQLTNLSVRGPLGSGDESLIVGFIISGDTPLRVLLTTRGPSLDAFGVTATASDPAIELFQGSTTIAANDNGLSALDPALLAAHQIFPLAPTDAALIVDLAPGAYTVVASNQGTGRNGLAEIYALPTADQTARLINLSARGKTEPGDGRLIAGFILGGSEPLPLLVRALGPTLTDFAVSGAAVDLDLELHTANNTSPLAVSDWLNPEVLGTVSSDHWPQTPLEPLTLQNLGPGAITVHALDPLGDGGIALIDVTIY
ncbi:DUF2202 domain-containing protein [Actomonas aquatica]|uniref:DUF2202 domain-containing protein n=1 Tax=Actomonas aquatica TaxID=2866162 RepID=A0ABZ1C3Q4_9BACT|nr:DUF2202 domain-containing protein [Opitutus sp. WL0086]WRQ86336.1 DUF2202 domain-containing protein [Opitutus sp. WL0086]